MEKSFLRSVMTNNHNGEISEVTNFVARVNKTSQFWVTSKKKTIKFSQLKLYVWCVDENRLVLLICLQEKHY